LFSADITVDSKKTILKNTQERARFIMARKQTRLDKLIAAWPTLPPHMKAAIYDIVQANMIYANSWVLWPGRVSRLRGDDRDHEVARHDVQDDDVKQKRCIKCKKWKDETQFKPSNRSKDGLTSRCRRCSSKINKERTAKKRVAKKLT
jgi:hypothetical protein